ncbi:MAG: glycoside hydrolase family 32 protein, partial [Lacipirellulaceae bacterium]
GYEKFNGRAGKAGDIAGDRLTGTLTSREFTIRHPYLTFRIGAGKLPGKVGVKLLVGGETVELATGVDSETMVIVSSDVKKYQGKIARLQIFDHATGGWGHINADDFRGTDKPVPRPVECTRVVRIDGDYLQLPLLDREKRQQPGVAKFTIEEDGRVLRFLRLMFPAEGQDPDFWYSADVSEFRGQQVTLRYRSIDAKVLERLKFSNEKLVDPKAYEGPYRPRFHFSPRMGWMNDVNGTHHHEGVYHLFYQSNPTMSGHSTGFDMHWGHSVSRDLLHWEEWPIALHPDAVGNIFSGTAMVIEQEFPGINDNRPVPTPALFFSGTSPFSQHLATTADGGRTWQRYPENPIVNNMGQGDRDPKVIWHEPSQHFVMILFVGQPRTYRILRSKDLKQWEQVSVLPGWNECPEFLQMKSPTTGEDLWLLYGGYNSEAFDKPPTKIGSAYQLGRFDGRTFTPVTPIRRAHQGPNFYGALTFANEPDGRHLMMGWAAGTRFPDEPFNSCATLPLRMTLRAINGDDVLHYEPAQEVEELRDEPIVRVQNVSGSECQEQLNNLPKEGLYDIILVLKDEQKAKVEVTLSQHGFVFDTSTKQLTRTKNGNDNGAMSLHPRGDLHARFLIDRGITECFWNKGEAAYSMGSLHTDPGPTFAISSDAQVKELVIYPMHNIWE